jgi:hypothetical protein
MRRLKKKINVSFPANALHQKQLRFCSYNSQVNVANKNSTNLSTKIIDFLNVSNVVSTC